MAGNQRWQAIPTQLDVLQFEEFVLPHLSVGRRGPAPKLSLHTIFNYVLRLLYLGCQWKELPIEKDGEGRPEIHYTRIYRIWRRWVVDGCIDAIFIGSVLKLHQDNRLDISIIHGDGTTAKKGGDNIGFNVHKKVKGDRAVRVGVRQPQRITSVARCSAATDPYCPGGWHGSSRYCRQSRWRL
jgi:hypothetical protein